MSDQDRRLIISMLHSLKKYDHSLDGLFTLISSLSCFEELTLDDSWKTDIRTLWFELETIYALAQNLSDLDPSSKKSALETVEEIKAHLTTTLRNYFQSPDPLIKTHAEPLEAPWLLCPYCIDAWESSSKDAMIVCPKCDQAMHNPGFRDK